MAEPASLKATVHGHVQGVSFRAYTFHQALILRLTGYTRNLPSGEVEVYAEGERARLEQLVESLKDGPPLARVEKVDVEWGVYTGRYSDFRVTR